MTYYERDEARHVGLGMQYLPQLMKRMSRFELTRLFLFQAKLVGLALWETKFLEKDLLTLGIEPRKIIERARAKQALALREAIAALGVDVDREKNPIFGALSAIIEFTFPTDETKSDVAAQARAAWRVFTQPFIPPGDALDIHAQHTILTARGGIAEAEAVDLNARPTKSMN
jgi:hypothetical protein